MYSGSEFPAEHLMALLMEAAFLTEYIDCGIFASKYTNLLTWVLD